MAVYAKEGQQWLFSSFHLLFLCHSATVQTAERGRERKKVKTVSSRPLLLLTFTQKNTDKADRQTDHLRTFGCSTIQRACMGHVMVDMKVKGNS